MKEYNCRFMKDDKWFSYRSAAIIIEDDCVLFAGNDKDDYLYSVGGAIHMGETAEDAVKREVLEETGVNYEIDHLAIIHENFFIEDRNNQKDVNCHEIAFYFLMKPRGTKELNSHSVTCENVNEHMYWIPIKELSQHKAFPSFLESYLSKKHHGIKHIITDER